MPKEFLKSLLWAMGLHGGILGILLFSWPYLAHSVFSLDRYRIFKVSLVSPPRLNPPAQQEAPPQNPPGRIGKKEIIVPPHHTPLPSTTPAGNPSREEKSGIPQEDKGDRRDGGTSFSLQVLSNGSPSEGKGMGGPDRPAGAVQGTQVSFSPARGTALVESLAVPRYSMNRAPYYPVSAREQGWQGTALLKVLVLKNGSAGSLEVVRSSGFSILDHSALKGVREWKFIPGQKDGQPAEMWVQIPVTFRLE